MCLSYIKKVNKNNEWFENNRKKEEVRKGRKVLWWEEGRRGDEVGQRKGGDG